MHYDVFNGDADGIIALLQLRLSFPKESKLITGVKRDICLLKQVEAQSDVSSVTVLDVSMDKNITALEYLLSQQIPVFYCDHHRTGNIPNSSYLTTEISLDAEVCTSLLINKFLNGRYPHWAIVAAFGDNLDQPAQQLAQQLQLLEQEIVYLRELGILINYNGYGADINDLHIPPAKLFQELLAFSDPFELIDKLGSPFHQLKAAYSQDLINLESIRPSYSDQTCEVYLLPCEPWARRMSGVFSNELVNRNPDKAHAVLTMNASGEHYTVSVRAPLNNRVGADDICCQFPTGGGRKAAAGINQLPVRRVTEFIDMFNQHYSY